MNAPPSFVDIVWIARWPLLYGLGTTVAVSLLAILGGTVLGTLLGLALTYGNRVVRLLARAYTDIVRGTPVLVLVLASFYILGTVGLDLSAFQAGVLALTLFCASHVGEITRGALQTLHKGQTEAAKAIGLTFGQTFRYVLGPQALRLALPPLVNTAAEMVKASTLLSVIGVAELLLRTQEVISRAFHSLEFYLLAGFLYFVVNYAIERLGRAVERRVSVQ
ncbi:ABC transporter permease [Methylobacterium indicum]|uniref:ABC transporter permease n=1 Tax=Methylobacterium indicum TaxID=1775910 RepID=A0A0J6RPN4_9HYPH|nr:amino acid ABC transporter permease [Methylobacterium indicum]KMO12642.1 ABC transporter permease [Methylobacterium indicum]KMO23358.1 ABC transporter permease [Methylobacterium indicum]KTS25145.1 ABC transporter permease [Methylobacterium indicum]KTS42033.1 ABC transporter permease [Methylobacterium indicum]KTS44559.1 ABC transporter permease [Methylobacterium indicum]